MKERFPWAKYLNGLLHDNFYVAKCYRKTAEAFSDVSLQYYFQKKASKRSQYAIELHEEITFLGGHSLAGSVYPIKNQPFRTSELDPLQLIRKCIKLNKASIKEYKKAIGEVNIGSSREILFRHKARIEGNLAELKTLKSLMSEYNLEEESDMNQMQKLN